MAYLLQILVVVISLRIKLGANKQITQLALYTMIGPKQKTFFFDACEMTVKSRVLHLFPVPHPEEAILACKLQILVFSHRFMARTLSRGP